MDFFNITPDEKMQRYQGVLTNGESLINQENVNKLVYEATQPEIEEYEIEMPKSLTFDSPNVITESSAKPVATVNTTKTVKDEEVEKAPDTLQAYFDKINLNYQQILQKFNTNRLSQPSVTTGNTVIEPVPELSNNDLFNNFRKRLSTSESSHNYGEINTKADSGAWGKYQFIWGLKPGRGQRDQIAKITGHKDPESFLKDPAAQEKYFEWYYNNTLMPELKRFRKQFPNISWTDMQTLEALHFRGYAGLSKFIREGRLDQKDSINPSVNSRIFKNISASRLNAKSFIKINQNSLNEMKARLGYK